MESDKFVWISRDM